MPPRPDGRSPAGSRHSPEQGEGGEGGEGPGRKEARVRCFVLDPSPPTSPSPLRRRSGSFTRESRRAPGRGVAWKRGAGVVASTAPESPTPSKFRGPRPGSPRSRLDRRSIEAETDGSSAPGGVGCQRALRCRRPERAAAALSSSPRVGSRSGVVVWASGCPVCRRAAGSGATALDDLAGGTDRHERVCPTSKVGAGWRGTNNSELASLRPRSWAGRRGALRPAFGDAIIT